MVSHTELDKIEKFVNENRQNILDDIALLVSVPSVAGAASDGAPFGEGPKRAVETMCGLAKKHGLDAQNVDGYICFAESGKIENGSKYLATITHLDVVPEGNGWDGDPFEMRIKNGWILGRGVADDKGPSVLCLYMLKYLKENNIKLKYPVRCLFGADEETEMKDIEYYSQKYAMPVFCFTPDAEFPVCNGEKGGFSGEIVSKKFENGVIESFDGGVAENAVPDRAVCRLRLPEGSIAESENVRVSFENGLTVLRSFGKSGHAAMPQNTVNAIGLIVEKLLESGCCSDDETVYLKVLSRLFASTDGSALGIDCCDGIFDPLTIIGGTVKTENGIIRQTFDCRYPTNTDIEKLTKKMKTVCGNSAFLENIGGRVPFYISPDSDAVKVLIKTYNEVTGENAKPFTMGGGTYARHFPSAVSFGSEKRNAVLPDFAGPMHGANEGAKISDLLEALKIYILAVLRLEETAF